MNPTGIILFAHGARDPAWARPFEAVKKHLHSQVGPSVHVALAFLEFMAPTLPEAGDALVEAGCQRITVVPLFLGAGGHVRKDLPVLMQQLGEKHPSVQWHLSVAVGETSEVVEALAISALNLSQHPGPGHHPS